MGKLLDGYVCFGRLSTILIYIGCRDEKWGMNKCNETKSQEKENCKGRAHGDETRGGCGVEMRRRKIDEDENWTDVDEDWSGKSWSELKFDIVLAVITTSRVPQLVRGYEARMKTILK